MQICSYSHGLFLELRLLQLVAAQVSSQASTLLQRFSLTCYSAGELLVGQRIRLRTCCICSLLV
jgi:hypothetical protein